ncbi:MAG TPA: AAA family ATPase [Methylomirabilota bacterium]
MESHGGKGDGRLELSLLGGWGARLAPDRPVTLRSRKAQALLAYLAIRAGEPHTRQKLMTLLWGECEDRLAGQSLRRALYLIRGALAGAEGGILDAAGDAVKIRRDAVSVDAVEFERLVSDGSVSALERAASLYRGELLEGIAAGSQGFDEWLRGERERIYELAVDSLARLFGSQLRAGDDEAAVQTGVRLLRLDAAQEPVHRALMRLYARLGRRAAALRQYQVCVDVLRRELHIEPERETTEVYLTLLQGESEPVSAPVASSPLRSRRARAGAVAEVPLIGRTDEVRALVEALESAAAADGGLVVISGEAGIGKTRLLAELPTLARYRGVRVLLGHCHQSEQVLPFRPLVEAVRDGALLDDTEIRSGLSAAAVTELRRLFPELGEAPPAISAGNETHAWLFEALLELCRRAAVSRPLALAVEDIHWADDMTLRFLAFAARRLAKSRMLVIVTLREEDLEDAPGLRRLLDELRRDTAVRWLTLDALSEAETHELVGAFGDLGGARERLAARSDRAWQASRGNPLIIVETIREILEHDGADDAVARLVPRRVRELIAARLTRLDEPARHVMSVAAVVAEPASFELLARAAATSSRETAEALERLVRRRVLQCAGDEFVFAHESIRHVAYDGLLPARRRMLHRAIGEAMEAAHAAGAVDLDDRLAHHFTQARVADKAVTHLTRFAEAARRRHALGDALRALDQALALVPELPEARRTRARLELLLHKGFVLAIQTRYQEILDLVGPHEADVKALDAPELSGPYYFRLGTACVHVGNLSRAEELTERAIQEGARCDDRKIIGMGYYLHALRVHMMGRSFTEGARYARQAIELLERAGETHYRGWAYYTLARHLYYLGELGPALSAAAQPEIIGEQLREPRLRSLGSLMGLICTARGEWEDGLRHCRRALERSGDPLIRGATGAIMGYAYTEGGDAVQAVAVLSEAMDVFHRSRNTAAEARFLPFFADALLLAGDADQARATASRALAFNTEVDYAWGCAWSERTLGRVALYVGDVSAAEAHVVAALQGFAGLDGRFEEARTRVDLGDVLRAGGRLHDARTALGAARERFAALDVPLWERRARDAEAAVIF